MVRRTGRGLHVLAVLLAMTGWIVLVSGLVFGQSFSAAISGVVRDASGAVVPEAAITVRQIETGQTRTAETNANGSYTVPSDRKSTRLNSSHSRASRMPSSA